MNVGITYNLKDETTLQVAANSELTEEFDATATIEAISSVLAERGHRVVKLGAGIELFRRIKQEGVDFVFNLSEGYRGRNRESFIPVLLEMLGVPFSGLDCLSLGLALVKGYIIHRESSPNASLIGASCPFLRNIPASRFWQRSISGAARLPRPLSAMLRRSC